MEIADLAARLGLAAAGCGLAVFGQGQGATEHLQIVPRWGDPGTSQAQRLQRPRPFFGAVPLKPGVLTKAKISQDDTDDDDKADDVNDGVHDIS